MLSVKSLKGRNLLSIDDLSSKEFSALIELARDLKAYYRGPNASPQGKERPLDGESLAMIFQKRSTRTRISTETGMNLLGGHALMLSSEDIQLGVNESLKDSAMVISRFNSMILARVYEHRVVKELAEHSSVPVINALCDKYHPLQSLADYMTLIEHFGDIEGKTLAWVGDGNNVLHDLMLGAPRLGVNVRVATPQGYEPLPDVIESASRKANVKKTSIYLTNDPVEAVTGADVVVTDTWVSMGQEEEKLKRLQAFAGYEVNGQLMSHANPDAVFLHCLPRHPEEVSDEVFYSKKSLVFDEAENRMWTVMAVMMSLLGKDLPTSA